MATADVIVSDSTNESEHQSPPAAKHDPLLSTSHLYYTDTYLFSCTAKVLAVQETIFNDTTYTTVILDQTVMHPQGGGQPTDVGYIISSDGNVKFVVNHVQKPKEANYIEHLGTFTTDQRFSQDQEVNVEVDADKRRYHARLHSAGHLLDSAFINLGITDLIPSKGYHFPDGPYVEYIGNVPAEKREEVIALLNNEANKLVKDAIPVIVSTNDNNEREINVGGTSCMCGGTHVKNTQEIGGVVVTKMKKTKKNIRVSYYITK